MCNSNEKQQDSESFFDRVLDIILRDVTGSTERPVLTRALLQDVLEAYGELPDDERVQDDAVEAMLQAAGVTVERVDDLDNNDPSGTPTPTPTTLRLTASVLAQATTGDVRPFYKLGWEDAVTTHFDDVFQGSYLDTSGAPVDGVSQQIVSKTTDVLATTAAADDAVAASPAQQQQWRHDGAFRHGARQRRGRPGGGDEWW